MPDQSYGEVTTIRLNAKCSDLCWYSLLDETGQAIAEHNGYVPNWMPGEHCGDYVELEIDRNSGRIINWKRPSNAALEKGID